MDKLKFLLLILLYAILLFGLLIYSFSQIDLNLTISSNIYYQNFQKQLLYLGYFNRPLSTGLYTLIVIALFIFYLKFIDLAKHHKINDRQVMYLITIVLLFLFFSYPAFSHDIYNYMFDARILTTYAENPYIHKALDFPNDSWIRFMHWTHRVYPYGPFWLLITLPFSYLGFGKFVITLINFKLMFSMFYIGNIIFISKILSKIDPKRRLLGLVFFALNPVILIESLVSPHNEIAMLMFLFLAIYLWLINKKFLWWVIGLLLSGGVKFVTFILLPVPFIYYRFFKKDNYTLLFKICLFLLFLLIILQIYIRMSYPWYFITLIGVASLLVNSKKITEFFLACTLGCLLYYIPYLYVGYYPSYVVQYQFIFFVTPVFFILILLTFKTWLQKLAKKKHYKV